MTFSQFFNRRGRGDISERSVFSAHPLCPLRLSHAGFREKVTLRRKDDVLRLHRVHHKILTQGLSRGVVVLDSACHVLCWNYWMEKHSGVKAGDIMGKNLLDEYPDIRERKKDRYIQACIQGRTPFLLSPTLHHYLIPLNIVRRGQRVRMFQNVKIYPLSDEKGGNDASVMILLRDMTELILHEKEIHSLSVMLEGIREINRLMVRAESETALIADVCKVMTENIGYGFAWIGLIRNADESDLPKSPGETISLLAQASAANTWHDPSGLKARWGEAEFRQGILGKAVRTGNIEISDDYQNADISEIRMQDSCCPCVCSLPLKAGGNIIGALDLHWEELSPFRGEPLKLLKEVADDISFTIQALRDKERHSEAEAEMQRIRRRHQARKMAALGTLAGGIAHDFNNLLTVIMGNLELAQFDSLQGSELDREMSMALSACARASELTQKFLTLSKGGAPITKSGSLGRFLSEFIPEYVTRWDICCELSAPDDLWQAEFDMTQMKQVFEHLITNSCEAMPRGGVIQIHAENIVSDSETIPSEMLLPKEKYISISLQDHGTGIIPEHLQRIFDPYFSTKEMGGQRGMGLGLTIVYSIIRNHGGDIRVTSEPGSGTTVQIWLPAADEKKAEAVVPAAKRMANSAQTRVLVMDDEEMIRDIAQNMLEGLGYEAECTRDGVEALESYQNAMDSGRPFDAVILDLTIRGGMGGREAIRRLKAMDFGVRAIVSSGYSNDPVMASYEQYGFSGVLPKPYQKSELREVLEGVLGISQKQGAGEP